MKYKTKKRIQGSISIFLVIIMVPMICLSGLIVDGSRRELAKGEISAAGDLTMNAALANYDTVLKDVYGLFAMSQTADDLSDNLYDYFVDTLMANGVVSSAEEIAQDPLLQDIASAFSGKTTNLLSMDVAESDFTAAGLTDSSLVNQKVLKNQIVEYQKYRAPINSALSLLDGVASLKKMFSQSPVSKAKTKVDEEAGELNDQCCLAYTYTNNYQEMVNYFDGEYTPGYFTLSTENQNYYNISGAEQRYLIGVHELFEFEIEYVIADLIPTPLFKDTNYVISNYELVESKGRYYLDNNGEDIYGRSEDFKDKKWTYFTDANDDQLLEEVKEAYKYIAKDLKPTYDYLSANSININTSPAVKKVYGEKAKEYFSAVRSLKIFYHLYSKNSGLKLSDSDVEVEIDGQKIKLDEAKLTTVYSNTYNGICKSISAYAADFEAYLANAEKLFKEIYNDTAEPLSWMERMRFVNYIGSTINNLEHIEEQIQKVDNANNDLKNKIDAYNGSDEADSFSKQMEKEHEYYKTNIDPELVSTLKQKLVVAKSYYEAVQEYYKSVKVADKNFKKYNNIKDFSKEILNYKIDGIKCKDYISNNLSSGKDSLVIFMSMNLFTEGEIPAKVQTSISDDPFYNYLKQAFGTPQTETEHKDTKKELEQAASDSSSGGTTPNSDGSVNINDIISYLPSNTEAFTPIGNPSLYTVDGEGNGTKFSSLFDSITNAFNTLMSGVGKALESGRDNLYVTEYVYDMFSYHTMEAEYKIEKNLDKSKTLAEQNAEILTSSGMVKNSTNCAMYGYEIEYIVFGKKDGNNISAADNVGSAKGFIFGIRFLANSAFALTDTGIKAMTLPPALAIQAATAGVVPYKLTQVILQLCLALAESGVDMHKLEMGEKVPLIKTKDTWTLSLNGALNEAKNAAKDAAAGVIGNAKEKATGVYNDLLNAGSEKIKVSVTDFTNDTSIMIRGQLDQVLNQLFSIVEDTIVDELDNALKEGKALASNAGNLSNTIISNVQIKINKFIDECPDAIKPFARELVDRYFPLDSYKSTISSKLSQINDSNGHQILQQIQSEIADKLSSIVTKTTDFINGKTTEMVDSLKDKLQIKGKEYIEMAGDKVLEVTNDFLDKSFDKLAQKLPEVPISGGTGKTSMLTSVLQFNYGDYLKIFLFLNLCVNDTPIMKRIGDVIQINIVKAGDESPLKHPKGSEFRLSNSYTYVEISANVKLRSMFTTLPIFTEYSGKSYSTFDLKYHSVLGY